MAIALIRRSPTGRCELARRSLWLQEAISAESEGVARREVLRGCQRADVCIVGGGYTGLWTALFLLEREPGLDIAIVEADICGGGASGRNAGFALSWWPKLSTLVGHCGEEDGRWVAEQSAQAVRYLETFCGQNGIDCQYRQGGWLWTASSAAQVGAWDSVLEAARSRDLELFEPVGIEESRRRGGSPRLLGGILDRSAARVHPGLLARGLRRVACDRGIRVYEESPVTGVDGSRPLTVRAVAGTVTADVVVSALNAWTFSLPQFRRLRRAVIPIASDMVASAPNPDLLERIGLTGGEVVSDSRMMVHYYRTTDDGRITFGKGGGAIAVAGYFGEGFHYDRRRAELTAHELRSLNPALAGLEVTHAWSGPVDRSINGLPFFGRADGQESMVYGVGFSGNGVAQCITGAKILAGLALRQDNRWTQSALARGPARLFPPEPARFLGGCLVRRAIRRKERSEDTGRTAPAALARLARLAPESYYKAQSPDDSS